VREALAMSLHELNGFRADLKALRTCFNQLVARINLGGSELHHSYLLALPSEILSVAKSAYPSLATVRGF